MCWKLVCAEESSTSSYHESKKNTILPPYYFQGMNIALSPQASQEVPPVQVF